MKGNKVVIASVGIILVVAVVIGVVVNANIRKSKSDDSNPLKSATKSVAAICSDTDYKQACVDSLSSLATNQSATPLDFLHAAINSTFLAIQSFKDKSDTIAKDASDPMNKMAREDCQELMQYAIDELQDAIDTVSNSSFASILHRVSDLTNWLSAVVSYQSTCTDGFTDEDIKKKMSDGLLNATQLTSNALAISSSISELLSAFKLMPSQIADATRNLIENTNIEMKDGYPSWVSSADRKLLGSPNPPPNAVVAKDGSGQFTTISAALAAYPKTLTGRYVIYVKAGIYNEQITVLKNQKNVFMYGDGPRKSIVTGRKSFVDGITTYKTATFSVVGDGFIAKGMAFQNTAGAVGHQAVALRVQADMVAIYNCRIDGYQDTLYVQAHRQFYRNCVISGTIDFIFGDASAVIQNCLIIVRRPMDNQQNTVTAQGRTLPRETTGLVIQNCRIVPEQLLEPVRFQLPTYLGRPWKEYSRTVIMECTLADFINPAGWMPWQGDFGLNTLYYAEYANRGPGANTNMRVKWKGFKVITNRAEALAFTAGPFIQANQWIGATGVPCALSLRH